MKVYFKVKTQERQRFVGCLTDVIQVKVVALNCMRRDGDAVTVICDAK